MLLDKYVLSHGLVWLLYMAFAIVLVSEDISNHPLEPHIEVQPYTRLTMSVIVETEY